MESGFYIIMVGLTSGNVVRVIRLLTGRMDVWIIVIISTNTYSTTAPADAFVFHQETRSIVAALGQQRS